MNLNAGLNTFARLCLWLRYRVRVRGRNEILSRGRSGILFLPNHPALIDPIIVVSTLWNDFAPRTLADRDQVDRFFIRWLADRIGVRTIPDLARYGPEARVEIDRVLDGFADDLVAGSNALLYPAGHIYRSRYEDLRGNSAVHRVVRRVPDCRVVLVRTTGLWGSSFSQASGERTTVATVLHRALTALAANGVYFSPRRDVTLELVEPDDFPREGTRAEINAYLEAFYNRSAPPNTYVPYTHWEAASRHVGPEPVATPTAGSAARIPPAVRDAVLTHLCEQTGQAEPAPGDHLARDLGLDSLARAELLVWIEREFGQSHTDVDSLRTVADVMLYAVGRAVSDRPVALSPPPRIWTARPDNAPVDLPAGETLGEVLLAQAARRPDRPIVADQRSGVKTYRDLLTGVFALLPAITRMEGEAVGIMLPASVAATTAYLAVLFAGKTPVMVNWTLGRRNMRHGLELTGVRRVLTAGALLARLRGQGVELDAFADAFVPLEDLAGSLGPWAKLRAAGRARLSWRALREARLSDTAAVLFTSGSEQLPKAVPLSHANILADLRDVLKVVTIRRSDCLLGMLPPFHSFGLTVDILAGLLGGFRTVYHADPTEAAAIARLVRAWGATLLIGTPTMLAGIARSARPGELAGLRLAVTGAEKCPPAVFDALDRTCPGMVVLEGYGVTEGSPIVAVNSDVDPRRGTIGRVLPSLWYALVDESETARVAPGERGMLLVRGPSIFGGYLGDAPDPFVPFEGHRWYRTGDLVTEDADGVLTFAGRRKRFIKLGGEMISLPAIEAVLRPHLQRDSDEGPAIAITSTLDEDHPEIVLFCTRPVRRDEANRLLRAEGLSPLHTVRRVVEVGEIPLLGTGKIDYRTLQTRLS